MKSRPVPFNSEMVLALSEGRKTMTRRIINPQPTNDPAKHHPIKPYRTTSGRFNWVLVGTGMGTGDTFSCPYGQPGDRLWVRETFRDMEDGTVRYAATDSWYIPSKIIPGHIGRVAWKNCTQMPRKYARIWLEITDVRVERVQDISEEDAKAEGARQFGNWFDGFSYRKGFVRLWESIHFERGHGFDVNDWVWVVSFKVISTKGNPDGVQHREFPEAMKGGAHD